VFLEINLCGASLLAYEKVDGGYTLDLGKCNDDFRLTNGKKSMWGIVDRQPCVFLQFKKNDPKWTPKFLNSSNLPSTMPEDLKTYIRENPQKKV
jgi:hypothetical protein